MMYRIADMAKTYGQSSEALSLNVFVFHGITTESISFITESKALSKNAVANYQANPPGAIEADNPTAKFPQDGKCRYDTPDAQSSTILYYPGQKDLEWMAKRRENFLARLEGDEEAAQAAIKAGWVIRITATTEASSDQVAASSSSSTSTSSSSSTAFIPAPPSQPVVVSSVAAKEEDIAAPASPTLEGKEVEAITEALSSGFCPPGLSINLTSGN